MKLQMLVSAVNQEVLTLADKMNIETDAIIINQCQRFAYDEYEHKGWKVQCYSLKEKGVGLSRNTALMRADADICIFADEDIVYETGYAKKIEEEFSKKKDADILLFNVTVAPARKTYWNETEKRVRWYNYGRYPAYSIAAKTEALHSANVSFSLLFGGGARYSNGEDSLFLRDCLKAGLRIYASPIVIGEEIERESTWFHGYNEKFFKDRGVLYRYLYGRMAIPFSLRFLLAHRDEMCREIDWKQAYKWMREGVHKA
ncbi:MAG: glycosyltransferase family 2 protein [Clostridiales bacterium]|nr:glycosyltransferase family 2 protein [Clostridiales bacterium]